ncbi:MAG: DUF3592 domain-containing protein [Planctomycetes bacterium]|nr:DUF3592 domain-containing protein [Planctomycetota bacterium]
MRLRSGPAAVDCGAAPVLIQAACIAFVELVGLSLLVFGLFVAWFAVVAVWHGSRELAMAWRSRRWATTRGTIERAVLTRSRTGRVTREGARISYTYFVGGKSYSSMRCRFATSLEGADGVHFSVPRELLARYPIGAAVDVYYDPERPEQATLDRGTPSVWFPWMIALLLLGTAAFLVAAGASVALGPLEAPPSWPAEELPPMPKQIGGSLLVLALIAAFGAWRASRRARREKPLRERIAGLQLTPIDDLTPNRTVAIAGTVEVSEAGTLEAPVSGSSVVYHSTTVSGGLDYRRSVADHRAFFVTDGRERVRIELEECTDQLPAIAIPFDLAAITWVDRELSDDDVAVPEFFRLEQRRLAPGDSVLVLGRTRRVGREGALAIRADDESGEPVVLAVGPLEGLQSQLSATKRRRVLCTWIGGVLAVGGWLLLIF